ncbi:Uncharacterized protein CLAVI_000111 [Candidatus Clavichlamydia salmonicola]|uniref:AMP nucleosidase n=1 Tax=Candidatus Clavichlamydia salmonicola TaxID=469812 RepID=UPI001890EE8D|nr:AMP nucleosidase [Candidatus Clavichlamydia salmonicola]MBF5050505.1 Uncharacterized protein [Candidatus Clavichlamydia salmonicola]
MPDKSFNNEIKIALDTLERYCGSSYKKFGSFLLLTNFSSYVDDFSKTYHCPITQGAMFSASHDPDTQVSILNFGLGSASAALAVDLCSFIPQIKAVIMLGLCGGLRDYYKVGDYFVPVGSIRGEGTSDFYFSPEVPALGNFIIQKIITNILDKEKAIYHIGITHTTNIRFWEFNEPFKNILKKNKPQVIEMECATLFSASYRREVPLGALLLISDLPLTPGGIKTKESGTYVLKTFTKNHINMGIKASKQLNKIIGQTKIKHRSLYSHDIPHMKMN